MVSFSSSFLLSAETHSVVWIRAAVSCKIRASCTRLYQRHSPCTSAPVRCHHARWPARGRGRDCPGGHRVRRRGWGVVRHAGGPPSLEDLLHRRNHYLRSRLRLLVVRVLVLDAPHLLGRVALAGPQPAGSGGGHRRAAVLHRTQHYRVRRPRLRVHLQSRRRRRLRPGAEERRVDVRCSSGCCWCLLSRWGVCFRQTRDAYSVHCSVQGAAAGATENETTLPSFPYSSTLTRHHASPVPHTSPHPPHTSPHTPHTSRTLPDLTGDHDAGRGGGGADKAGAAGEVRAEHPAHACAEPYTSKPT